MTYTLTAEQMQQVREKVSAADFSIGVAEYSRASRLMEEALALLDAAMQAPEATAGGDVREAVECGICGRPESYGDHDASQLPATLAHPFVPKPMLEAYRMGFITGQRRTGAYETAAVTDYRNTMEAWAVKVARDLAALAAAPKPEKCPHGCVDGWVVKMSFGRNGMTTRTPCPIHGTKPTASEAQDLAEDRAVFGTKPEAPTERCKVCGELEESVRHIDALHPSHHPSTPTDATPKDEEPGR